MTPVSHTVLLDGEGFSLSNTLTVAVGEKLEERYYLMECTDQSGETNVGDYFTFQAVLQYENAGGNTSTVGVISVEYDVILDQDMSQRHRSANITLNYTASA